MPKFCKRPVEVDAEQWFPGVVIEGVINHEDHATINTLEGVMRAEPGDWIITGVHGEKYPCKPDIFEKTYRSADQKPFWETFVYDEWCKKDAAFDHKAFDEASERYMRSIFDSINYKEALAERPKEFPPFAPHYTYCPDGDFIEVLWSDEPSCARWLNPSVSILLSIENKEEVVGVQIARVKREIDAQEKARSESD